MIKRNKPLSSKLKYQVAFICFIAIMLFASSTISEAYEITDTLALLIIFVSIILLPFVIVATLIVSFILNEIIYKVVINLREKIAMKSNDNDFKIHSTYGHKLLKITHLICSEKTQKEVFQVIVGDWDEEVFLALKKKETNRLIFIHARNTYAFIMAMWQKSPLGDLIEYVRKFAN